MQQLITETVLGIELYINTTWGKHFTTQVECPLKELFPKPENSGLNHIWKHGSADLVVRRKDGTIACIIEAGGGQHFKEKQSKNDARKWKLCQINGVKCLMMMNSVFSDLSKRKWRQLLGKYVFNTVWLR